MSSSETARLRKLYQMEVLDTPAEQDFDEIVQLASQLAKTPISLITLLDTDRQWFKAKVGLDVTDTDRPSAVCNYTIQGDSLFEVEDLSIDKRFERNPLVKSGLKLRYYAGLPLITSDGHKLGALCVLDTKSRTRLKEDQVFALRVLARQAMNQIEMRVKNKELMALKTITDRLVGAIGTESESAVSQLRAIIARLSSQQFEHEKLAKEISGLKGLLNVTDHSFANIISWAGLQLLYSGKELPNAQLKPLVNQCLDEINDKLATKNNKISTDVTERAELPVPAEALKFIIRNLLDNANRFTNGGEISLRYFTSGVSRESQPRHYICISDTGMGIPDTYLQAFAQNSDIPVRPDTEGNCGHGHGLMLIRHVLQQLGGKMHIESSTGNHCNVIVII